MNLSFPNPGSCLSLFTHLGINLSEAFPGAPVTATSRPSSLEHYALLQALSVGLDLLLIAAVDEIYYPGKQLAVRVLGQGGQAVSRLRSGQGDLVARHVARDHAAPGHLWMPDTTFLFQRSGASVRATEHGVQRASVCSLTRSVLVAVETGYEDQGWYSRATTRIRHNADSSAVHALCV